jgi:hypothetical protein
MQTLIVSCSLVAAAACAAAVDGSHMFTQQPMVAAAAWEFKLRSCQGKTPTSKLLLRLTQQLTDMQQTLQAPSDCKTSSSNSSSNHKASSSSSSNRKASSSSNCKASSISQLAAAAAAAAGGGGEHHVQQLEQQLWSLLLSCIKAAAQEQVAGEGLQDNMDQISPVDCFRLAVLVYQAAEAWLPAVKGEDDSSSSRSSSSECGQSRQLQLKCWLVFAACCLLLMCKQLVAAAAADAAVDNGAVPASEDELLRKLAVPQQMLLLVHFPARWLGQGLKALGQLPNEQPAAAAAADSALSANAGFGAAAAAAAVQPELYELLI